MKERQNSESASVCGQEATTVDHIVSEDCGEFAFDTRWSHGSLTRWNN